MSNERSGPTRLYVVDVDCECGRKIMIPVSPKLTDPFYVAVLEQDVDSVRKHLNSAMRDVHQLALEALDHGLESSYLRKLDEVLALFRELKERLGDE
jgi:hypothetical protein